MDDKELIQQFLSKNTIKKLPSCHRTKAYYNFQQEEAGQNFRGKSLYDTPKEWCSPKGFRSKSSKK